MKMRFIEIGLLDLLSSFTALCLIVSVYCIVYRDDDALFPRARYVNITVSGASMEPTLHNGGVYPAVIVDERPEIKRGSIVACPFEILKDRLSMDDAEASKYGSLFVKRVIGLPNDRLYYDEAACALYINGKKYAEPYIMDEDYDWGIGIVAVPEDCVFLMGDNRKASVDSRDIGCVPISGIVRVIEDEENAG